MPLRHFFARASIRRLAVSVVLATLVLSAVPAPAASDRGAVTGLPLPRYASLASDEINVRSGPGLRHPILWQFRQDGLPVLIRNEIGEWRLIEDADGAEGWVHAPLLSNRRTVIVMGGVQNLLRTPSDPSRVVLRLEPGVIVDLESCPDAWCQVGAQADGALHEGWLRRDTLWGLLDGEAVE